MENMCIRDSLIGIWRLESYQAHGADGKLSYPLGKDLLGLLAYTEQGFMSVQIMRLGRPNYSPDDLQIPLMEEMATAANGYIAYAGRFTVDGASNTVTHHIELSLSPNWAGTEQIRFVALAPDRLLLSGGLC
jgi:hypothetical protein